PFFGQVGYLFLATTEAGLAELAERAELQRSLGVAVEPAAAPSGVRADDVVGAFACWQDGLADPPAVARELVRRAAGRGVDVQERTDATTVRADAVVIACGAWPADVARAFDVELPIRPLCRRLLETTPMQCLPAT